MQSTATLAYDHAEFAWLEGSPYEPQSESARCPTGGDHRRYGHGGGAAHAPHAAGREPPDRAARIGGRVCALPARGRAAPAYGGGPELLPRKRARRCRPLRNRIGGAEHPRAARCTAAHPCAVAFRPRLAAAG